MLAHRFAVSRNLKLVSRGFQTPKTEIHDPAGVDDDPYIVHERCLNQEEYYEGLGYNKKYLDFTDEC